MLTLRCRYRFWLLLLLLLLMIVVTTIVLLRYERCTITTLFRRRDGLIILVVAGSTAAAAATCFNVTAYSSLDSRGTPNHSSLLLLWSSSSSRWDTIGLCVTRPPHLIQPKISLIPEKRPRVCDQTIRGKPYSPPPDSIRIVRRSRSSIGARISGMGTHEQ